jgi:cell surface protein SprA
MVLPAIWFKYRVGAMIKNLMTERKKSITNLDFSTNLQIGKFFGTDSKVQIPFYYQYSQTVRRPKYDPLDLDLLLKEN